MGTRGDGKSEGAPVAEPDGDAGAEGEGEGAPDGVRAIDHTADVGLDLSARTLPGLLARSAQGLAWLLLERTPSGPVEARPLRIEGAEPASLLRETLRELLWWHEAEGLTVLELCDVAVAGAAAGAGGTHPTTGLVLTASARLARDAEAPIREIKGVTLHGLVAERRGEGWVGRVIFDV